jgi:hypothetical protein
MDQLIRKSLQGKHAGMGTRGSFSVLRGARFASKSISLRATLMPETRFIVVLASYQSGPLLHCHLICGFARVQQMKLTILLS